MARNCFGGALFGVVLVGSFGAGEETQILAAFIGFFLMLALLKS